MEIIENVLYAVGLVMNWIAILLLLGVIFRVFNARNQKLALTFVLGNFLGWVAYAVLLTLMNGNITLFNKSVLER